MNIVFLGPPGSGKGTQAEKLAVANKLKHLSTGDVFRAALKSDSELGKEIKGFVESGKLVPDHLVSAVVFEKLKHMGSEAGLILDGYPRTVSQAIALEDFADKNKFEINAVVNFDVPEAELFKRLSSRRKLEGRLDDKDEVIAERIKIYHHQTEPVLKHYHGRGSFINVNAHQSIDDVYNELVKKLKACGALGN